MTSGWLPAEQEPAKEEVDWDMYLGPAAWRPFNAKLLDGFNFEKGGGLVGGGVLEWGSHCVDLCQWAVGEHRAGRDNPPKDGRIVARYADGVELIFRETAGFPWARARCGSKVKQAGSRRATAARWSQSPSCWGAKRSRKSTAIRPHSMSATSWIASSAQPAEG